jgi:hypothetical protein
MNIITSTQKQKLKKIKFMLILNRHNLNSLSLTRNIDKEKSLLGYQDTLFMIGRDGTIVNSDYWVMQTTYQAYQDDFLLNEKVTHLNPIERRDIGKPLIFIAEDLKKIKKFKNQNQILDRTATICNLEKTPDDAVIESDITRATFASYDDKLGSISTVQADTYEGQNPERYNQGLDLLDLSKYEVLDLVKVNPESLGKILVDMGEMATSCEMRIVVKNGQKFIHLYAEDEITQQSKSALVALVEEQKPENAETDKMKLQDHLQKSVSGIEGVTVTVEDSFI